MFAGGSPASRSLPPPDMPPKGSAPNGESPPADPSGVNPPAGAAPNGVSPPTAGPSGVKPGVESIGVSVGSSSISSAGGGVGLTGACGGAGAPFQDACWLGWAPQAWFAARGAARAASGRHLRLAAGARRCRGSAAGNLKDRLAVRTLPLLPRRTHRRPYRLPARNARKRNHRPARSRRTSGPVPCPLFPVPCFAAAVGGEALASGICPIVPQCGHFPFLPAAESGVRTSWPQAVQENSIGIGGRRTAKAGIRLCQGVRILIADLGHL